MLPSMRITAGQFRNREIKVPGRGARPTQDKVRQALFSALGGRVVEARVLDLFAGSGALGLEAWSRGAAEVWWVERDPVVYRALRENVAGLCGADTVRAHCVRGDVRSFISRPRSGPPFDVILADPPYARPGGGSLLEKTLNLIRAGSILSAHGVVVWEQGIREPAPSVEGWILRGDKTYGDTRLLFYQQGP
jgi:16S rRNA (guanine966-N2)-methyltransferase